MTDRSPIDVRITAGAQVSVVGHAQLDVEPDTGTVTFDVSATGPNRKSVRDLVVPKMKAAWAVLESADELTSWSLADLWVSELKDSPQASRSTKFFVASATGTFVAPPGEELTRVVDSLVDEADASIRRVAWTVSADHTARSLVRQDAVRAAVRTAADYAQAAGLRLGPLTELSDTGAIAERGYAVRVAGDAHAPTDSTMPTLHPAPLRLFAAVHATFQLDGDVVVAARPRTTRTRSTKSATGADTATPAGANPPADR